MQFLPTLSISAGFEDTSAGNFRILLKPGITKVALSLTDLSDTERQEVYRELELISKFKEFTIALVYGSLSMPEEEYWYLTKTFGTQKFLINNLEQDQFSKDLSKLISTTPENIVDTLAA